MKQAIIIIGGYNSLWPAYLKLARDLEDLTRLPAVGVPVMPWHWWAARRAADATSILQKLRETVTWARRRWGSEQFVLVGHSAGGVIARLYLYEGTVWGHAYAGVEHVRMVVTLGSPHCGDRGTHLGWFLSDEANRLVPGVPYTGLVGYRAVAGRSVVGDAQGTYQERRAFRMYHFFSGKGDTWGDGVVPVESARLEGAETLILEGVSHSAKHGRNWYGHSKAVLRRWWPAEETDAG
jgi:pimeloyl-ACP methyl ester carboxylesterase